jgi:uncharacterized membrane protein YcaP (DUF421 family)
MMSALSVFVNQLLGLGVEPKDLTFVQITLRGAIVLIFTLIIVRLGDRRSLSKKSAFDAALLIILASALARAINGSAPFFATLGGSAVIVGLHRALGFCSGRSTGFRTLIKGSADVLIREGAYQRKAMAQNDLHTEDVHEDMRLNARTDEVKQIACARLESSGDISFIKKESS